MFHTDEECYCCPECDLLFDDVDEYFEHTSMCGHEDEGTFNGNGSAEEFYKEGE